MTQVPDHDVSGLGYPRHWEADVLLTDGRPVHLRPITPADDQSLAAFHRLLSERTVYLRYFAPRPELSAADLAHLTTVDHRRRVALVALRGDEIVAVGRFEVVAEPDAHTVANHSPDAEVAFVVRDDLQGLGLGSILLEHLAAAAREIGISRFVAEVLPANARMLATFREAGYSVTHAHDDGVVTVAFSISPTDASRAVQVAREHRAESRSVDRLLHPSDVVVIGEPGPWAAVAEAAARNVICGGFTGPVTVVGIDAPPGAAGGAVLADAATSARLGILAVAPERLETAVDQAAAAGVVGLVVASASANDADADWPARQAELTARARARGMRLVGPNALGVVNADPAVRLNASLLPRMPRSGRIGVFCQSAAVGRTLMDRLEVRGLGVSTFVGAGNRADVSGNDLLQYWADDPGTDVVLLYLESIGNARKFARLVRTVSAQKPVIMVRAGGAEHRHPLGHAVRRSGLPAAAVDQVLADCGLIVVDRVADLLDVAAIAATQPLPGPGTPVVVANSEALATLTRNALDAAGLDAGRAPVLLPRAATGEQISAAVQRAGQGAGLVLVVHVPAAEATGGETAGPWDAIPGVPVVAVLPGVPRPREGPPGVPVFQDVEDAVHAAACLARLASWRAAPHAAVDPRPATAEASAGQDTERETGRDLERDSGQYAGASALRLVVGDAAADWIRPDRAPEPTARGVRVRVQADPLFGPVVSVGVDDPVAEALADRQWRLAPVDAEGAAAMLGRLGAGAVLDLGRDPDVGDDPTTDGLADTVALLSRAPWAVPGLVDLDVRGLRFGPEGGRAAAATATVDPTAAQAATGPVGTEPAARRLRAIPHSPVSRVDIGGTMRP